MMSAASFVHYNRQDQHFQHRQRQKNHFQRDTPRAIAVSRNTVASSSSHPPPSYQPSKPRSPSVLSRPVSPSSISASSTPSLLDCNVDSLVFQPISSPNNPTADSVVPSRSPSTSSYPASIIKWRKNKYDQSQQPEPSPTSASTTISPSIQPSQEIISDKMVALDSMLSMTQPIFMKLPGRSVSTTGPVQIPTKNQSETRHTKSVKRQSSARSSRSSTNQPRSRLVDVHAPDSVPPSVAALLALTDIPKPRRNRSQRRVLEKDVVPLTVDSIMERVTDTELSFKLSKTSLDMLLLPPDEVSCEIDSSVYDSDIASTLGLRTDSLDSVPSLASSSVYGTPSSLGSSWDAFCPSSRSVSRSRSRSSKQRPTRAPLEPLSSPSGEPEAHPLSKAVTVDELDFRVFDLHDDDSSSEAPKKSSMAASPFPRMVRSAFKSNLTASLRAIKNAAKSISSINLSSIPPDDFLTRSILTIDPRVPFTDERRPPVLEEEPSAALRRYLNPTSSVRIEPRPASATDAMATMQNPLRPYTASIQMQTYKVYKSRNGSRSSGSSSGHSSPPPASTSSSGSSSSAQQAHPHQAPQAPGTPASGMRQREMRENPDFIRIAVLEMAMRRNGKLDESVPGRARWALPPRKPTRICEVTIDGIPERWVSKIPTPEACEAV
ncbi:hypothetical protein BROUX41_005138 [Berkeleyomyces rouxiae]|uniref:uncharacterized protein n=1 Tax=Berkeleyomyces rouxiae TaxID=2035830 RepID=UPI003B7E6427